ncbi:MAG TPA: hypothetical protein K8V56_11000 [Sporosarcina psychrophila]|uniref:Uncharacterized protein n=1 Tax=Sporosarcina psychrophila TaxID=1476 RepID=A0A921G0E5_SPOPS|nr:hypothetical protein [Sporosarcina psychrophila]
MGLNYIDLNKEVRELMITELNWDIETENVYISNRLTEKGKSEYTLLLNKAFSIGNDETLAKEFIHYLKTTEERKTQKGISQVKVPSNAAQVLAEGEYNRYYIRGLCLKAITESISVLEVYRAKQSQNPRSDSEAKIGSIVNPQQLLQDLRKNPGIDTALGLPNGPNSGLSVRLP